MAKRGPEPLAVDTTWTPELAYVVGIFASDGNLGRDSAYLDVTSTDREVVENVKKILKLDKVKVGVKRSGNGDRAFRVQFKRVNLHAWFTSIGLHPNKSKTIGPLNIPDDFFFDFLRGVWDGDGCIYAFWDPRWRSSYMFYISFASASPAFLEWLQESTRRLIGVVGKIGGAGKGAMQVRYAKKEARTVFNAMFHQKELPCLKRKFTKAQKIFTIDERNAQKWHY